MKLTRIFALSAVVFYLAQENETDALVARMIEGGANLAIDIGLKMIKIPIMIGGRIVWKCVKVPTKFAWSLAKIPFKIIIRLAKKFGRKPYRKYTPDFIQDVIREQVTTYRMNQKLRKQKKSKIHRFKTAVRNKINTWEINHKIRKQKHKNNQKKL